jgi:hypothetical protein
MAATSVGDWAGSRCHVQRPIGQPLGLVARGCSLQLVCYVLPAVAEHAVCGFDLDADGQFGAS